MKKISFLALGLFVKLFGLFAQTTPADTSKYAIKKLSFEEANFVSSYYSQDGSNAAVTGGVGSQKLTDFANVLDVKLTGYGKNFKKHTVSLELGIDHYTSASSDKIDLTANTSASYSDTRFYPSAGYTMEDVRKHYSVGGNIYISKEFDYFSKGVGVNFSKSSPDNNTELSLNAKAYFDEVSIISPVELRTYGSSRGRNYPTEARNSYSASATLSRVVNPSLQVAFIADAVYQQGYLSMPFYRTYFTDNSVLAEKLPSTRVKIPLGIRANYFAGDRFIFKNFYRYYNDTWGINAHTAETEVVYKASPYFSISPFYRFYNQTATTYFAAINQHKTTDEYYTSNYDLSGFTSHYTGLGMRFKSGSTGLLGIQYFNAAEIRYGYYTRSNGLNSQCVTVHLQFK